MTRLPKIALAQLNPTVGDLDENAAQICEWANLAERSGAGIVLFPELVLTGYPAEDLYLRPDFIEAAEARIEEVAAGIGPGVTAVVGYPARVRDPVGRAIAANAAAVVSDGEVRHVYQKRLLPNYGVFDEYRTFRNGNEPLVIDIGGTSTGITVCEDCWDPESPVYEALAPGARLILNASASPYHRGKGREREEIFRRVASEKDAFVAMTNLVGGQDDLIFDGASAMIAPDGGVIARAGQFSEDLLICEAGDGQGQVARWMDDLDEVYTALVTGLRDYVTKNGFGHVGLGLSGGIDSALVAALAVDALGPEQVTCVVMPSPHSSGDTQGDAREMARRLGTDLLEYSIDEPMLAYDDLLGADAEGLAAENLQARIRGNLMMALSNSRGWLILTTANKSETSVGYSTLYGDMAGGLAPIKDVPKTLVYDLCRYRNGASPVIPESIISRPPSAELRPDQLDTDSLPDYDQLDRVLQLYVEEDLGPDEIVRRGEDPAMVADVIAKVDRAEYKRRQSPPGLKVTTKGFGRDRRMPITNRYRPWSSSS